MIECSHCKNGFEKYKVDKSTNAGEMSILWRVQYLLMVNEFKSLSAKMSRVGMNGAQWDARVHALESALTAGLENKAASEEEKQVMLALLKTITVYEPNLGGPMRSDYMVIGA